MGHPAAHPRSVKCPTMYGTRLGGASATSRVERAPTRQTHGVQTGNSEEGCVACGRMRHGDNLSRCTEPSVIADG